MDAIRTSENGRVERQVAAVLLVTLAAGCVVVLRPFLSAVLWAAILVCSTWPIYVRSERLLGGRRRLAAALMITLLAVLFVLPLAALGSKLASEVPQVTAVVTRWMDEGPPQPPDWLKALPIIGAHLGAYWQSVAEDGAKLTADLKPYVRPAGEWVLSAAMTVGAGITELVLSLLIAFFFYRDGAAGGRALRSVFGRVGGSRAEQLILVAVATVRGVVYGIVGTNLVEAILATLGLWIAGVPGAFFLGFAIFFLTLVPVAPALVFVPAVIWLIQQGATTSAFLLSAWYVLVFMVLEGALRSYLVSRGGDLPLLLVFLGMLGGVIAFGFLGIFLGPTLLAVGYALVREWTTAEDSVQTETGDRGSVPGQRFR
jgi:predicted PurR-regulated permease PerM